MTEDWRPVPSASGYEASSHGRIRTTRQGQLVIVRARQMANGYIYVDVTPQGRRSTRTVHSLVTEAFHGPRPAGYVVRHLDGTRTNNTPENLRWGTPSENQRDRVLHGTHRRSSRPGPLDVAEMTR